MRRSHSEYRHASGWHFEASTLPISGAPQLLALARGLADPYAPGEAAVHPFCVHGATRSLKPCVCGSALVMGVKMHLPEATFGANKLILTHEPSGFVLSFTAEGALRAWARDSVLSDRELHIRVAPAEKAVWRSRVAAAQERTSQAVDWTFCSGEYGGDDHGTGAGGGGSGGGVGGAGAATALPGLPKPALSAGATARGGAAGGGATSIKGAVAPSPPGARAPAVVWREHEGDGLDMDLLRRRDEIAWSAEVPLYEDHLHDQGVSTLIARIRVMPQCFLVLLRHTLRVDGRLMQQREVRVFHRFGTGVVLRQHRLAAKALPPLPRPVRGAPEPTPPPFLRQLDEQSMAELLSTAPDARERTEEATLHVDTPSTTLRVNMPNTTLFRTTLPSTTLLPTRLPLGTPDRTLPMTLALQSKLSPCDLATAAPWAKPAQDGAIGAQHGVMRGGPATSAVASALPSTALPEEPTKLESTFADGAVLGAAPRLLRPMALGTTPLGTALSAMAVSADGSRLLVGACDGALQLLSLQLASTAAAGAQVWRCACAHAGGVAAVKLLQGPEGVNGGVNGGCLWGLSSGDDSTCAAWAVPAPSWAPDDALAAAEPLNTAPRQRWELECALADRILRAGKSYVAVGLLATEPPTLTTARGSSGAQDGAIGLLATEPPTGARFAAAVGASLFLLDVGSSAPRRRLAAGRTITAIEYLGARRLLCASGYGGVVVWNDFGEGGSVSVLVYKGPLDTMAGAPDERYMACGAQDGTLVMWPLDALENACDCCQKLLPSTADSTSAAVAEGKDTTEGKETTANGMEAETPTTALCDGGPPPPLPPPPPNGMPTTAPNGIITAPNAAPGMIEAPSEAEAAQRARSVLYFSGGCYEHKVGPLVWEADGRCCASAGGRRVVVWDMGAPGTAPPVRQNGRSSLLLGHRAAVTWVGFAPAGATPPEPTGGVPKTALLAAAAADGRIWMHALERPEDAAAAPAANKGPASTVALRTRQAAKIVEQPSAATDAHAADRESPFAWTPQGWLLYGKGGEVLAVRY